MRETLVGTLKELSHRQRGRRCGRGQRQRVRAGCESSRALDGYPAARRACASSGESLGRPGTGSKVRPISLRWRR